MAEQASKSTRPITNADFEAPFESNITRFGVKGINITDAIDAIEPNEMTRMLNVTHRVDGFLTTRPGQTQLATGGTNIHSGRRLNDPDSSTYTRVYGVDTTLKTGTTGALATIDTGYSGSPLSLVTYRADFSADPWMYVGDSAKMRKVRADGLDLPIGLSAPGAAISSALATEERTTIMSSNAGQYASWAGGYGMIYGIPIPDPIPVSWAGSIPPPIFSAIPDQHGNFGIAMVVAAPVARSEKGYFAFGGVVKTLNLNKVGTRDATDEDYIHLSFSLQNIPGIKEIRVYFCCGTAFAPTILPGFGHSLGPGVTPNPTITNTDAYLKVFSASDFTAFIAAQQLQIDAAQLAQTRALRDQILEQASPTDTRPDVQAILATRNPGQTTSLQAGLGEGAWNEFGIIGIPLRRGDFQRIGSNLSRDWGNINGIILCAITGPDSGGVTVGLSDIYLTGGYNPDTGEPGETQYDYRATNYDTRTGAESNPSPIMGEDAWLDTLRRKITVDPAAYGDGAIRQKIYRRGGTLPTDWQYLGTNGSDGGLFDDTFSDEFAAASTSLETDNYQPVPTVDENGNTILNQPLPIIWGPLDDLIFGCGDPHRAGDVYFCKPGQPDSWPPDNRTEVCSSSDKLMAGVIYGGQSFVFSQEKLFILYPNLSDGTSVTAANTQCTLGMVNQWAVAVGMGGIYFVSPTGIYRTTGGPQEWLSKKIDPIFMGQTKNGVPPIDFSAPEKLRLAIYENELWFQYQDTEGNIPIFIFNIPFGFWRQYQFRRATSMLYADEGNPVSTMLLGGQSSGAVYTLSGTADDGTTIPAHVRTGAINFGRVREEKRLGDQSLNLDTANESITLQNFYNYETIEDVPFVLGGDTDGRATAIYNAFGDTPKRVNNISTDISWVSDEGMPSLFWLGTSAIIEPDVTVNRVTQWDDLGNADESYLTGITLDCDTGGEDRTILVEYDLGGVTNLASTLVVNCDGRHKVKFSWAAVNANKVRLRPADEPCEAWILYKADWIFSVEPPRISKWDSNFENGWDQYYTGLDLFCNTFGLDKTVEVYVDGVLVKTEIVNTNGRLVWHITIPWGRGHVFRFIATDNNPGMLYGHRWQLQEEPSEQTNWNQNFSVEGIESDKYLKAIVFQCDTFGATKSVTVEVDGVVVETLLVNTLGRKVVQKAFPQHLGRVFRVYPTDNNPSRLYSLNWVFDTEPLALDRWETQELDHGIAGWFYPIFGHICVKSMSDVTLTIDYYNQTGGLTTKIYILPNTNNLKQKLFVPFQAVKCILAKYTLTSADPFWLYKVETDVSIRIWGGDQTIIAHIFGDDDLDATRPMTNASLAAARPGGGA